MSAATASDVMAGTFGGGGLRCGVGDRGEGAASELKETARGAALRGADGPLRTREHAAG